ncbi:hypothetical protein SLEP1_g22849 [Rubroshorea leprosula]|uniref:Integrase catalytic domain-containing protein n=1 Tax=Rubroshorea leprosula TaxID=152421 RepID=A0AAV5JMH7_9ROSI|nr:hypothetical protein SLEP1_g22849 [Rubroshorea leprosula]
MQALNYVLIKDVLYRRGHDELLLRCLGPDESFQIHGFFWPSVLKDCIAYAKGCKSCQIHGPLQRVPASELNPIVKPWPFQGWAIDLIGKVYPPSSKGHSFIIVAMDYFTKWVEAKPMKKVNQSDVIKFIKEDIIHRFGLPETITTDQGTIFVSHQVEAFAKEVGFRLLNSTPHYAQANGQAEASNKVSGEYDKAMMLELEDLEDTRLTALDRLQAQKLKIAKSFNKRVKGPFRIHEVLREGAYWLESLDGELHPRKINGIYLKPYYPTVWEARGMESQEAI